MTISIMDGHTGSAHVTSDDWSVFNQSTYGAEGCVFNYEDNLALTMLSATSGTIGVGAGIVCGRRFRVTSAHAITFESCASTQTRIDLVVARYAAESGVESVSLVVIKGTPATSSPTVPTTQTGDLVLHRVTFTGSSSGTSYSKTSYITTLNTINNTAKASHTHAASAITSGTLSAARGGTGYTTLQATRSAMGLGNTTGAVPIANGGTGSTTAANARTNLGITPANIGAATSSHTHTATGAAAASDYVIAEGTSGIWYYRKWNSGKKECWASRQKLSLGSWLSVGNIFYTSVYAGTSYPWNWSAVTVEVSKSSNNSYPAKWLGDFAQEPKGTTIGSLIVFCADTSDISAVCIDVYAYGY